MQVTRRTTCSEPVARNKVEIRATLVGQGPQDLALERVVSRLSLEPGVSAVTWELVGEDHAE